MIFSCGQPMLLHLSECVLHARCYKSIERPSSPAAGIGTAEQQDAVVAQEVTRGEAQQWHIREVTPEHMGKWLESGT